MSVYYRKLAATSARNLLELAVIPLASAGFLIWVVWKSVPGLGGWNSSIMHYLYVMLALGVVLLLIARALGQTTYFKEPIEAYHPDV
jgi:hypothetical protein